MHVYIYIRIYTYNNIYIYVNIYLCACISLRMKQQYWVHTYIYIYQSIGDIDNYLPTCISCPEIGELFSNTPILWMGQRNPAPPCMVWNPINNGINHLSTGAGFRNHPQYHVRLSGYNGFILWKIPYGDLLLGKLANYINGGFSSRPRLITITG